MPKEVKTLRINPERDESWKFLEKNEDMTITAKNSNTGEEIDGIIKSISTSGFYTIEIIRQRTS